MKRIFLSLAALLVGIILAVPLTARADSSEHIENFITSATLETSGALQVNETISYNFGSASHHGIYRSIPTQYQDDAGKTYRLKLTFGRATMDNAAAKTDLTADGSVATLKIGDPSVLVGGSHIYRLTYTLMPVVMTGDHGDILKLNLTGNGWDVPIDQASAAIHLGPLAPTATPQCYTGDAGSKNQNCSASQYGSVVSVATTGLASGEGLSVFIDLPAQSVGAHLAPYVPARPSPLLYLLPIALYAVLLGCGVMLIAKLLAAHRLRKNQTIVAQYEAPAGLTPIELGLLNDDRAGLVEITATLVDLAVRGHLKITQTEGKKLLASAKYRFDRLTSSDPVQPAETQLLAALFDGSKSMSLSDVDNAAMQKAVAKITSDTGAALTARGLYQRSPGLWRVLVPAVFLVIAAIGVSLGEFFLQIPGEDWASLPFAACCALALGFMAAAAYLIRQPAGLTLAGAQTWAQVRGFKLYLTVAEKDRLNFSDAPAKTPELFNKLLPAAIALGVEKQWAKQFEGIDVMKSAGWYGGYPGTNLSAVLFASSLSSDFSSGIRQSFTVASSSGSSGGGFSGGGFGGGGGGSW